MPETEAPQTKEPAVQVGDVWQSNGPKKAKVRVLEITSLGLVRWSGITIRDAGAAHDFARNRVLVERDGKPVGAEEPRPTAAPRNCSTCRHWGEPHIATSVMVPDPERDTGLRKCNAVPFYGPEDRGLPENPAALAYAHDGEGYLGELLTRAGFGCVLHESTEQT